MSILGPTSPAAALPRLARTALDAALSTFVPIVTSGTKTSGGVHWQQVAQNTAPPYIRLIAQPIITPKSFIGYGEVEATMLIDLVAVAAYAKAAEELLKQILTTATVTSPDPAYALTARVIQTGPAMAINERWLAGARLKITCTPT